MGKFSAKNKIFTLLTVWLLLTFCMFFYLFGILDMSNLRTLEGMDQQKKDLAALNAERQSYIQAKGDLDDLAKKSIQPEDFFSKDITLVNEIRTLEGWGNKLGVQMTLSGVSGTINSVPKAKTITPISMVPYSINLTGSFSQAVDFIEVLENLNFITNINNIGISAGDNNQVTLSLGANFYLKR